MAQENIGTTVNIMTKTLKDAFVAGYICSDDGQQLVETRKSEDDIWNTIKFDYYTWLFPNGIPEEPTISTNIQIMTAMERANAAFFAYFEDDLGYGDMPVDIDIVGYSCDEHWHRQTAIRIEQLHDVVEDTHE